MSYMLKVVEWFQWGYFLVINFLVNRYVKIQIYKVKFIFFLKIITSYTLIDCNIIF